ncbi:MAG: DapH/DapD/GlmU-related protein [Ferruginibacter sp.]
MIKEAGINLLMFLGRSWSYVYSHKTSGRILLLKRILYSGWLSREFKSFGKKSVIHPKGLLIGGKYISIGDKCSIGKNTAITAWDKHYSGTFTPQIIIGNNVSIGSDSHITAINKIEIGNNVLTGKKVTITDNGHGDNSLESLSLPPAFRHLYSSGPVIIGDGVWIGDKVTILPNVSIGKNAIIGANAVVTKNIPANCIAGGIPARIIKIME